MSQPSHHGYQQQHQKHQKQQSKQSKQASSKERGGELGVREADPRFCRFRRNRNRNRNKACYFFFDNLGVKRDGMGMGMGMFCVCILSSDGVLIGCFTNATSWCFCANQHEEKKATSTYTLKKGGEGVRTVMGFEHSWRVCCLDGEERGA